LKARSYFYHLLPVAVGCAQVESLTSYLVRLAEAHDVTPGVLLTQELLPRVREAFRRHVYRPTGKPASTFLYDSHTLNGGAQCAHDWVNVLVSLTGVKFLQSLTMLTWRQVISERGLLRRHRAWCPCCYEDWRGAGTAVYDPLLWSIGEVSVCPFHNKMLEDRCPHCEQNLHLISAKSKPGHCGRCRRWLGRQKDAPDALSDRHAQVVAANSIGELLSAAPKLAHKPSREHFLHNVRFCIEDLADGNMSRFAAATNISFDAIIDWSLPDRLVRLSFLSRICSLLGISPLLFVNQRIGKNDLDCNQIRRAISQKTSHIRSRRTITQLRSTVERVLAEEPTASLRKVATELGYRHIRSMRLRDPDLCDRISMKRRTRAVVPYTLQSRDSFPVKSVIKKALTRALLQPISPPLKTISKALGFRSDASLYVRFPDLCKAFAKKKALSKQSEIDASRRVVAAAVAATPPPSLIDVARRIGYTIGSLTYRFPDLCAKLSARLPERKLFLHQQLSAIIGLAISEEPVPSLKSIAGRVGMTAPYLRTLHPDLYAQIQKGQTDRKNRMASIKRAAFQEEIRAAVLNLSQLGIAPSRKRVFASIRNPSLRSTQILDRQIAVTKLEIQVASGGLAPAAMTETPVRSAGNHPLAVQDWNHNLA
jgi:hypothetical protein